MAKITFKTKFHSINGPAHFEDFEKQVLAAIGYANRMVYVDPGSAPKRIASDMGNRVVVVECIPNMIAWQIAKHITSDRDIRAEIISVNMELDKT